LGAARHRGKEDGGAIGFWENGREEGPTRGFPYRQRVHNLIETRKGTGRLSVGAKNNRLQGRDDLKHKNLLRKERGFPSGDVEKR